MRFQMSHRSRNTGLSWSSDAQISTPGINGLEAWSQFWACEEPVAGVGAQICPSSSPSVICRGQECTDGSQSFLQRP